MTEELKRFNTKINTWAMPIIIRAFNKEQAEGLARIMFKVPTTGVVTATELTTEEMKEFGLS